MNTSKWTWIAGIGAGLLSVLCCVGPVIPILLGIGGASLFLGLDQYMPVFIGLGILVLTGASWLAIRHRRQCCARPNPVKDLFLVSSIFGVGLFTYAVFQFGIIPVLSQAASQKLMNEQKAVQSNPFVINDIVDLKVEGMTCAGCAVGVQKVLSDMLGIVSVDINWKSGKAKIQYQADKISPDSIQSIKLPSPYVIKYVDIEEKEI